MSKIKFTKGDLKRQNDDLKRFDRFLPMLQLKKQQLQIRLRLVDEELREANEQGENLLKSMSSWIGVLGQSDDEFRNLFRIRELHLGQENVAGVKLPVYMRLELEPIRYDLFETPLWMDQAFETIGLLLELDTRKFVLDRRRELLAEELIKTSQRVNLFERVKIPAARNNIRRLKIFLGDQQAAAVVRGKIAKRKRQSVKP